MTKQITLIRHAAIAEELSGYYIGSSDVPLSPKGIQQAENLVHRLNQCGMPPIETLWCSPAQRARQTAEPLIRLSTCPISFDTRLLEIDFGDWEGLDFAQILRNDPQRVNQWAAFAEDFSFPGGESLKQFCQRLDDVVEAIQAEQTNHLAIVSHGGVLRGLICRLLRWPLQDHLKFVIERGNYATVQIDGLHAVLTGLNHHAG